MNYFQRMSSYKKLNDHRAMNEITKLLKHCLTMITSRSKGACKLTTVWKSMLLYLLKKVLFL